MVIIFTKKLKNRKLPFGKSVYVNCNLQDGTSDLSFQRYMKTNRLTIEKPLSLQALPPATPDALPKRSSVQDSIIGCVKLRANGNALFQETLAYFVCVHVLYQVF